MSNTFYTDQVRKELRLCAEDIESQRNIYLAWLLAAIGTVSFGMTFLLLYINPGGMDLRYTVTFGALAPSTIVYIILGQLYLKKCQARYLECLCRVIGFHYREDGCFSLQIAEKHKILPDHNRSTMENGIQGQCRGAPLALQEIVLTALKQDPNNKKKKKEFLRFWGLLVRIQLRHPMAGHTVFIPGPLMQVFFRQKFRGYEKVTPNDGRFHRFYEVRTTDKIDAKFIFNSTFQDNFSAATKTLRAYWAVASFNENEILLAFQRFRPLINPTPLWKPANEDGLIAVIKELEAIARIVAGLKSNPQVSI